MATVRDLEAHLRTVGPALLGYSGGVDSALLAVAATRALGPARFLAVIGRSASYPATHYQQALAIAGQFGIPLLEVATGELADPRYRANAPDRCYFCKHELWRRLGEEASARGFPTILDGTNASDLADHRPGMQAAAEHGIRSPLVELGWTKPDVRAAARDLGLPVWDAPASPCLSSRIAYGLEVTAPRLQQVEQAEAFLRSLGVAGDLRVRHHGASARIEAVPEQFALVEAAWESVQARFRQLGFADVILDPRGYRRGSLLVVPGPA